MTILRIFVEFQKPFQEQHNNEQMAKLLEKSAGSELILEKHPFVM
jgi:hypothetical protein